MCPLPVRVETGARSVVGYDEICGEIVFCAKKFFIFFENRMHPEAISLYVADIPHDQFNGKNNQKFWGKKWYHPRPKKIIRLFRPNIRWTHRLHYAFQSPTPEPTCIVHMVYSNAMIVVPFFSKMRQRCLFCSSIQLHNQCNSINTPVSRYSSCVTFYLFHTATFFCEITSTSWVFLSYPQLTQILFLLLTAPSTYLCTLHHTKNYQKLCYNNQFIHNIAEISSQKYFRRASPPLPPTSQRRKHPLISLQQQQQQHGPSTHQWHT